MNLIACPISLLAAFQEGNSIMKPVGLYTLMRVIILLTGDFFTPW